MSSNGQTHALVPTLRAPAAKPHVSVARMTDYWYVACQSKSLKTRRPLQVTILGVPLAVFRGHDGSVGALLDRCPHRNVPLSIGKVEGNCLQCPYHGWEFETDGQCSKVPGLIGEATQRGREAVAFPVREQQGFVWVFMNPDVEPTTEPYPIPLLDDGRYTHARREAEANGTLHATIENALDVPHTSFLHKGLFRGTGVRNDITAVLRRWGDRAEVEYVGEPRPDGLMARILARKGGEVVHFDRFVLPSIAIVDYALGDSTHLVVTTMCTPVSDFETKLYAVVSFRLRFIPGWLVKPFLEPVARKVFAQDARVLQLQTNVIQQFGGEQFVSTELDVIGPHIWRLMKEAERGDAKATVEPTVEKRVQMNV